MPETSQGPEAAFFPGQLVRHRLFGYRGVVYDVDPEFAESEEWYAAVAKTRPPKDRPWYHVLVHGQTTRTYVAERNLELDPSGQPVEHPLVEAFFAGFADGRYRLRVTSN